MGGEFKLLPPRARAQRRPRGSSAQDERLVAHGIGLCSARRSRTCIRVLRRSARTRTYPVRYRHGARGPRLRGNQGRGDRRLAGLAGLVAQQTVNPALGKALLPAPHRRPADADALRHPLRRVRSEEHTSELQLPCNLVCRLLLEKKTLKFSSRWLSTSHSPISTPSPL